MQKTISIILTVSLSLAAAFAVYQTFSRRNSLPTTLTQDPQNSTPGRAKTPAARAEPPSTTHLEPPSNNDLPNSASGNRDQIKDGSQKDSQRQESSHADFGTLQPVPAAASPHAAALLNAIDEGRTSELSILLPSERFNQVEYEKEPEKWLKTVAAGRAFQCAQPGPEIPQLKCEGSWLRQVRTGEELRLAVKAAGAAGAPISFVSLDLGGFKESGGLSALTLKSDENGLATATFVASPGCRNSVNILAGCPLASGQAHFKVVVEGVDAPVSTIQEDNGSKSVRSPAHENK